MELRDAEELTLFQRRAKTRRAFSLVYAGLLQLARIALHTVGAASSAGASSAMRRTALVGVGSAFAALIGTYLVQFVAVRDDPAAFRRLDPKEPAPPGGIDPHSTAPDSVVAFQVNA